MHQPSPFPQPTDCNGFGIELKSTPSLALGQGQARRRTPGEPVPTLQKKHCLTPGHATSLGASLGSSKELALKLIVQLSGKIKMNQDPHEFDFDFLCLAVPWGSATEAMPQLSCGSFPEKSCQLLCETT